MRPLEDQIAGAPDLDTIESAIQPGQAIVASWRGKPVFLRNLMPKEIAEAK